MTNHTLIWESSYEIVLSLIKQYPDADIDNLTLDELNTRILALPGFNDDPDLVNDKILRDILREWYEEIGD